ncbi:MAG: DUF3307 domain-containing protein [Paludibacteraceae bacterium]|nr:DUF3307 domain-containing protein [Paludibacteraceae bacterium]
MYSHILYNLFLAHIVADFYLQTDDSCKAKTNRGVKSKELWIHALLVFVLSWLVVFDVKGWWLAAVVGVSHLLIDALKPKVGKCVDGRNELWVFLIDQGLHIGIIALVSYGWLQCNSWQEFGWLQACNPRYVLLATSMLLAHKPSNILINLIIRYYQVPVPTDVASETTSVGSGESGKKHGSFHSGALIGTMERVLMIILIVLSQYEAIGFLIAAKSILRFSDVNESEKSEYVVAGTFLSFGIALLLGLLIVHLV